MAKEGLYHNLVLAQQLNETTEAVESHETTPEDSDHDGS